MAGRIENLRPRWVKGQSGNPKGRPRRARAVIDVLGLEARERLLHSLLEQALKGDTSAAKLLLDRMDPLLSRRELTGHDGQPIQVGSGDLASLTTEELRQLDAVAAKRQERMDSRNASKKHSH